MTRYRWRQLENMLDRTYRHGEWHEDLADALKDAVKAGVADPDPHDKTRVWWKDWAELERG